MIITNWAALFFLLLDHKKEIAFFKKDRTNNNCKLCAQTFRNHCQREIYYYNMLLPNSNN